jgi:hypothetical protein
MCDNLSHIGMPPFPVRVTTSAGQPTAPGQTQSFD